MEKLDRKTLVGREEVIALTSKQLASARIKQRFDDWISINPHVVDYFVEYARAAKAAGHEKISAWLIVNRVRWETEIVTTGNPFKISNDFIAPLSKMVMDKYPDLSGFFTTRT